MADFILFLSFNFWIRNSIITARRENISINFYHLFTLNYIIHARTRNGIQLMVLVLHRVLNLIKL